MSFCVLNDYWLPPNQQRQSTEGTVIVFVNLPTIFLTEIFARCKSLSIWQSSSYFVNRAADRASRLTAACYDVTQFTGVWQRDAGALQHDDVTRRRRNGVGVRWTFKPIILTSARAQSAQRHHTTTSTIAASTCLRLSLRPSVSSTSARQRSAHRHNGLFTSHELNGTGVEFARTTVWTSTLEYTEWSDVTASMVTTRSPFCGYNTT